MSGAESESACQVRIGTDRPCPRPAVTEILGVPFCERCAGEQKAYFTIGEVMESHEPTDELSGAVRGLLNESLVDALHHLRREIAGERHATRRLTRTRGR